MADEPEMRVDSTDSFISIFPISSANPKVHLNGRLTEVNS